MTAADFKPGDVLELTQVSRNKMPLDTVDLRTGLVVEVHEGYVIYIGHHVDGYLDSGTGAFKPEEVGTKRYGFHVSVKKIGRAALPLQHHWTPRPGDTGYDLMC